nr:3-deoxy-D-manno-octulosonic acid transferase [Burkholderiales bacterium]
MLRLLYSLLLLLATPLIMLRLLWRGVRQPEYRRHWRERWGFPSAPPLSRSIWIHAVSVGEIRATVPLVQRLRASRPSLAILITCMTP